MKHFIILSLSLLLTIFIACVEEDNNKDDSLDVISVTTSDVNEGSYYYNLVTTSEAADTATWHLSFQNIDVGGGYYMPSIILSDSVMVAVYNTISFDEISVIPEDVEWSTEVGIVSYGGDNEVISYDMETHVISVSDENYMIYDTTTHKVFKLHFDEYSSGILLFNFAELTE
jgi:hypothetical protein|tara:strand:- start:15508 stop:16023 length:516 start_codon:yes stop_codon:yes gene_type:complete